MFNNISTIWGRELVFCPSFWPPTYQVGFRGNRMRREQPHPTGGPGQEDQPHAHVNHMST